MKYYVLIVALLVVLAAVQFNSWGAALYASPFLILIALALLANWHARRVTGLGFWALGESKTRPKFVPLSVNVGGFIQIVCGAVFFVASWTFFMEPMNFTYAGGGPQTDSGGPEPVHGIRGDDKICTDRGFARLSRNAAFIMQVHDWTPFRPVDECRVAP